MAAKTMWTEEQQKTIALRNRNLLVSAAAGAGKTAVLVERILTMLTEDDPPVDIDRLLVVTFTEAAAAEMKERILDAIEQKMEEQPDNIHLAQQATLLNNAQICTIDSFCQSVIRDHFHEIQLDPGFRVAQEGECTLLKQEVLEDLFEEKYQEGEKQFLDLSSLFGDRVGNKNLGDLIDRIYESSRCNPDPEGWLKSCLKPYQATTPTELSRTLCGERIREKTLAALEECLPMAKEGLKLCQSEDGPAGYEAAFQADVDLFESLLQADSAEAFYEQMEAFGWKWTTGRSRKGDLSPEKTEQAKVLRQRIRERFKEIQPYFENSREDTFCQLAECLPVAQELVDLTITFGRRFQEKKQEQNLIDFSDMEQYALQILAEEEPDGEFVPTRTAGEYQEQFVEVMVDEYQDINLLQETILTCVSRNVTGGNNLFMVGDVKQSIYGFRSARPDLFLEKYDTYTKEDGKNQRIDLHKNFRSRPQILDSVNALFRQIMRRDLGGIEYDDDAALYPGADYEEPGLKDTSYDTEMLVIDSPTDEELEARAIAARIRELMQHFRVRDARTGKYRNVQYRDIVILLRSTTKMADALVSVFTQEGIPVYAQTKEGYFSSQEVQLVLSYLTVLDNRQQDIPLTAVLTSPIGGLTEKDLAVIRTEYTEGPFFRAVEQYRQDGQDADIRQKLEACLGQMDAFREQVPYLPIHELLWEILDQTGYGDFAAAMPGGEQRSANLEMLIDQARTFESSSYKGLFHFIRYMEQIQEQQIDFGMADTLDERADTVRIMTIHKSKGLEFPIVFVAGMGKGFANDSAKSGVTVSNRYGIGVRARNIRTKVENPSLVSEMIRKETKDDYMAEEIRLLYVALTRAKEKLILTGTLADAEKKLEGLGEGPNYENRRKQTNRWNWVLRAALHMPEDIPLSYTILSADEILKQEIETDVSKRLGRAALEQWDAEHVYDPEVKDRLEAQFSYTYPYAGAKNQQMKFTVSELKKRTHMLETMEDTPPEEELGEELYEEPDVVPLIPKFMQKEQEPLAGADRGTAYHRVLELLDLTRTYDEDSLMAAVNNLAAAGKISQDMADCIRPEDLLYFLKTDSGQRMREAAQRGQLHREQPFVLGVDSREIYPDAAAGDLTLVQGIIDAYFEEPDGLVVLDYKTDKVNAGRELVEKYHAQVEEYARALEQMLEKPVKEKIIYSFTLREEIRL